MSREGIIKLRSTVTPTLMRYTVLKGTLIASLGAILLVYCGGFLPVSDLNQWGVLIWFLGIGLIAYGLVPYKRLLALTTAPNEMIFDGKNHLHYMRGGKHRAMIPIHAIEKVEYYDHKLRYGIRVSLKQPEKGVVFLPFFSKRVHQKLNEILNHAV